ncbi:MAG TPA: cyclase family protein [Acidimicrobiia bacterium]|nr:cyclase family protein [Acidimicrobiia bacterium]
MSETESLPSYRELETREGAPPGSSWGLWGDDDQLGTLNLLTDERTRNAVALVRRGAVFPLNLPLEELDPQLAWRTPVRHHILHVGHEARGFQPGGADDAAGGHFDRDDYVDGLWLQAGSQWDGLTHVRHREFGNYNGVADSEIHGGVGTKLGVDQWAKRAIVGRGVLLDVAKHLSDAGRAFDVESSYQITVADLEGTAEAQGVTIETGDILLLHTGWMRFLLSQSPTERTRLINRDTLRAPGLEPSRQMIAWIWDRHFAAIACDSGGVESMAPDPQFYLHFQCLPLLGIPLGEFWALDELAEDCARDAAYAFLLVSVPFNIRGGVGSPPQAVAIK